MLKFKELHLKHFTNNKERKNIPLPLALQIQNTINHPQIEKKLDSALAEKLCTEICFCSIPVKDL
ncbi:MAG: hypothetical protein Q8K40_09310, partial [Ignavibacteria bacterium]|nr:hypothetical protein [Ignavibacteria bacterium]